MTNYPYLYDENFLKEFDKEYRRIQYTRILVLDFNTEQILATISGKATGGSCTFSGTSSMRRVGNCSLLVTEEDIENSNNNITDVNNLISMNKKIKLETGFLNNTGKYLNYDIIWFPLGTYVIKSANISKNNSGINISLTLNDKCALLNGDMGGIFPAGVLLSEKEDYTVGKDGSLTKTTEKLLIKDMIKYIVVDFGGEDPARVIINDIPDTIVKVMKWIGREPLYYQQDANGGKYFLLNQLSSLSNIATYNYGQDVCYMNEPFVYPGKLECNVGETVASVLDKIKNVLGNYEWFYDINGNFIFQEIKNYLNTSLSTTLLQLSDADYRTVPYYSTSVYTFSKEEENLLSSISNNPQYQNIKNDFTVWGTAKTTAGVDKPIRYRLVLGNRPTVNSDKEWRAIVYKDYKGLYSIIPAIVGKTCKYGAPDVSDKTKYYIYNKKVFRWIESEQGFYADNNYELCNLQVPEGDWRTQLYFEGIWADRQTFAQYPYAAELISEWPKIFNIKAKEVSSSNAYPLYIGDYYDSSNTSNYEYWLDIIEGSPFGVESIGRRQKVVSEKDVNCLFPVDIPNLILIEADGDTEEDVALALTKAQEVVQVSTKVFNNLTIGGSYNSAFDKIKNLLYNHTSYNESISLSIIPIYHLEPNTRITVKDKDVAIDGDYMIKSISLPLSFNGTSTISATKIAERTF